MYPNIELIMNPSIAPVYMTATNMIMPIVTITNEAIAIFVSRLSRLFATFIMPHVSFDNYKLFITGIMLIAVGLMFADKIAKLHVNKRVEEMERQLNYMKKAERMRENDWELLMQSYSQSFKQLQEEFNKKFANYDRQLKKMDKELKMYQ